MRPPFHQHPGLPQLLGLLGRRALGLGAAALCCLALASRCGATEAPSQHEYELKAAVLYHILGYVDWPSDASSNPQATLQLGLVGDIPFAAAIELLNGKTVQGRKLVVKHVSPEEATQCQAMFIGASEKARLPQIVAEVKNRPILTVSEVEGFAEQGGMVNLVAGPNRIVMEINREVAGRARLGISSQLLKLARVLPK